MVKEEGIYASYVVGDAFVSFDSFASMCADNT